MHSFGTTPHTRHMCKLSASILISAYGCTHCLSTTQRIMTALRRSSHFSHTLIKTCTLFTTISVNPGTTADLVHGIDGACVNGLCPYSTVGGTNDAGPLHAMPQPPLETVLVLSYHDGFVQMQPHVVNTHCHLGCDGVCPMHSFCVCVGEIWTVIWIVNENGFCVDHFPFFDGVPILSMQLGVASMTLVCVPCHYACVFCRLLNHPHKCPLELHCGRQLPHTVYAYDLPNSFSMQMEQPVFHNFRKNRTS